MTLTDIQLLELVQAGGGISIDSNIHTRQIKELAQAAQKSGSTVIIKNASRISVLDLIDIARQAPGKITFDF
jgi:hypothetical protein